MLQSDLVKLVVVTWRKLHVRGSVMHINLPQKFGSK